MTRSALVLAAVALAVAVADLAHKALAVATRGAGVPLHERPAAYALLALAALGWSAALVATRAPLLAAAGGLVAGGAAANVLSLALWPGVPDPIVAGGIAFNVADLAAFLGGAVAVPFAAVVVALRSRGRLGEPVAALGRPRD